MISLFGKTERRRFYYDIVVRYVDYLPCPSRRLFHIEWKKGSKSGRLPGRIEEEMPGDALKGCICFDNDSMVDSIISFSATLFYEKLRKSYNMKPFTISLLEDRETQGKSVSYFVGSVTFDLTDYVDNATANVSMPLHDKKNRPLPGSPTLSFAIHCRTSVVLEPFGCSNSDTESSSLGGLKKQESNVSVVVKTSLPNTHGVIDPFYNVDSRDSRDESEFDDGDDDVGSISNNVAGKLEFIESGIDVFISEKLSLTVKDSCLNYDSKISTIEYATLSPPPVGVLVVSKCNSNSNSNSVDQFSGWELENSSSKHLKIDNNNEIEDLYNNNINNNDSSDDDNAGQLSFNDQSDSIPSDKVNPLTENLISSFLVSNEATIKSTIYQLSLLSCEAWLVETCVYRCSYNFDKQTPVTACVLLKCLWGLGFFCSGVPLNSVKVVIAECERVVRHVFAAIEYEILRCPGTVSLSYWTVVLCCLLQWIEEDQVMIGGNRKYLQTKLQEKVNEIGRLIQSACHLMYQIVISQIHDFSSVVLQRNVESEDSSNSMRPALTALQAGLNDMRNNRVSSFLISQIFRSIFAHLNAVVINSLLESPDLCKFNVVFSAKVQVSEIEEWAKDAGESMLHIFKEEFGHTYDACSLILMNKDSLADSNSLRAILINLSNLSIRQVERLLINDGNVPDHILEKIQRSINKLSTYTSPSKLGADILVLPTETTSPVSLNGFTAADLGAVSLSTALSGISDISVESIPEFLFLSSGGEKVMDLLRSLDQSVVNNFF